MNDTADDPAGLMILSLWTEPGERLRVRITSSSELGSAEPSTSYASTKAEVLDQVVRWIDSLVTHR